MWHPYLHCSIPVLPQALDLTDCGNNRLDQLALDLYEGGIAFLNQHFQHL